MILSFIVWKLLDWQWICFVMLFSTFCLHNIFWEENTFQTGFSYKKQKYETIQKTRTLRILFYENKQLIVIILCRENIAKQNFSIDFSIKMVCDGRLNSLKRRTLNSNNIVPMHTVHCLWKNNTGFK